MSRKIRCSGISCDNVSGETFVTVGHDSQLKHWRCPDTAEGDFSEPVHSIPLNGVAHSVSHVTNSTDYVTCGEGIHVWKQLRYGICPFIFRNI